MGELNRKKQMSQASTSNRSLTVILGPKTTLAGALLSSLDHPPEGLLLVARHASEADELARRYPGIAVLPPSPAGNPLPEGVSSVVVYCCAVGPIHAGKPEWTEDQENASANLDALIRIANAYRSRPLHLIYVSSVLALMPRGTNTYYSGWKNIIEAGLQELIAPCERASYSVFYPGRLVTEKRWSRPNQSPPRLRR